MNYRDLPPPPWTSGSAWEFWNLKIGGTVNALYCSECLSRLSPDDDADSGVCAACSAAAKRAEGSADGLSRVKIRRSAGTKLGACLVGIIVGFWFHN